MNHESECTQNTSAEPPHASLPLRLMSGRRVPSRGAPTVAALCGSALGARETSVRFSTASGRRNVFRSPPQRHSRAGGGGVAVARDTRLVATSRRRAAAASFQVKARVLAACRVVHFAWCCVSERLLRPSVVDVGRSRIDGRRRRLDIQKARALCPLLPSLCVLC